MMKVRTETQTVAQHGEVVFGETRWGVALLQSDGKYLARVGAGTQLLTTMIGKVRVFDSLDDVRRAL